MRSDVARFLDLLVESVVVCDGAGRVILANRAALHPVTDWGLAPGDLEQRLRTLRSAPGARAVQLSIAPETRWEVVCVPPAPPPATLRDVERTVILERLRANGWRIAACARELGISRTTLWRRLRSYGVPPLHRQWP